MLKFYDIKSKKNLKGGIKMPNLVQAKLISKVALKENIFKYSVESEELAKNAKPGQFLEIRVSADTVPFLRRPISIHNIDKEKKIVEFIFQIRGKGTEILSTRNVGEYIDILGPLGNGSFEYKNYKNVAVIGGGIGIFPLYELVKEKTENTTVTTYLGFRNKELVTLEKEFKEASSYFVLTTDDGSYGENGFAINYLKEDLKTKNFDCIYACGPMPMLKAVQELSKETGIPAYLSLEKMMGCGLGACLGCNVMNVVKGKYDRVCKEGPVFLATDVEL